MYIRLWRSQNLYSADFHSKIFLNQVKVDAEGFVQVFSVEAVQQRTWESRTKPSAGRAYVLQTRNAHTTSQGQSLSTVILKWYSVYTKINNCHLIHTKRAWYDLSDDWSCFHTHAGNAPCSCYHASDRKAAIFCRRTLLFLQRASLQGSISIGNHFELIV